MVKGHRGHARVDEEGLLEAKHHSSALETRPLPFFAALQNGGIAELQKGKALSTFLPAILYSCNPAISVEDW